MNSSVSLPRNKRAPLVVAAGVIIPIVLIGAVALARRNHRAETAPVASAAAIQRQILKDDAGKVGDLQITEEAMQLAEIKIAPAEQRVVAEKLPVSGNVEAGGDRVVKVTPRVPGKIVSVFVVAGDEVRAGQTLATIESTELAQAQAAYRQAVARVAVAENNLERQKKLAQLGVFGQPKVEEARKEVATTQGEIDSAEREVAAARTEVAKARSEKAALEGEVAGAQSDVTSAESEAASAQSQITKAEGQVKSLQAALSQAQTQVKVNQSRFNRMDALLKEQLVSKQDWEQAQADLQRAQADVDAAQANIAQAQAEVEATKGLHKASAAKVHAAQAKVHALQKRVEQAEANIETAIARLAQAEARLASLRKRGEIAQQSLAREEAVYKGGYVTSKEIVEAEASLRQAQLEGQAGAQTVRLLGGTPGGGSTVALTTPIAGRIQERNASPGETVDVASLTEHALFTVINLDLVWAQLAVSPKDLPLVRPGQQVALTSETAPGRTFTGTISAIGNTADEDTRMVRVRCALINKDSALRPGTFVRGNVITDVRRERVTVPTGALQEHSGKPTVYVALDKAGAFEVRHVKLGVSGEGWREIASGLKAGEPIAVNGTFYLKSEALKSSLSDGCCAVNVKK